MDGNGNCITADEVLELHLLGQISFNQQLVRSDSMRSVTDIVVCFKRAIEWLDCP